MMLTPVLVKLIADVEIVPDKVKLNVGTLVMVLHEYSGETYRGKNTVLGYCEEVREFAADGFFVRPWEYTPDLGADIAALQANRIENLIHKGFAGWSETVERKKSREMDSGCHWKLHGLGVENQTWQVSWIEETGELYAVCIQGRGDDDEYMVLARTEPREEARAEWFVEGYANWESPLYNNLTALWEQIQVRKEQAVPLAWMERFAKKKRLLRWTNGMSLQEMEAAADELEANRE